MLAVSPLRNTNNHESQGKMENFSISTDDFPDFTDENLLDSIDFDDLFVGIDIHHGDLLPDLEMDPELLAHEFSVSGSEESELNRQIEPKPIRKEEEEEKVSGSSSSSSCRGEETGSKRDESESESKSKKSVVVNKSEKKSDKARKSSAQSMNNKNNPQGKRKIKVDWTPELHRRFVQAVEQLGVDKAVPSRILEIMGINCLTRHNIASHLQKYRSHRKHLLAREAEAASWTQRRQMYGGTAAGGGGKRDINPWIAPTMGFPPIHHFRPLHVWGHPSMDQSLMHTWPKHHPLSPSPPPSWIPPRPPPPPPDSSYWHPHQHVPNALTPGTPCFPQALAPTRFGPPPVQGIPPHAMYKLDPGIGMSGPRPVLDFHPSKESIDTTIGDALSKPWQPLPLGLKPPSLDSVLDELQRQGVPEIPPTCALTAGNHPSNADCKNPN